MSHPLIKKLLPHFIVIILFIIIAAIFCKPSLEGKVLSQHDIIASVSEGKEINDYAKVNGEAPLWANNLFGGMPSYQIGMPGNIFMVHPIKDVLSFFTPQPMQYFFLCCVMFYFLSQVLKMNTVIGFFGSIAFAYCVYNPVIVSAGHITKIWCIAFIPALIASLILLYEKKYLLGFALTALFTCLQIGFNHLQITFYTFFILAFMSVAYVIQWIINKEYKHAAKAITLALIAGTLGFCVNAVSMLPTADYAKKTIRGGSLQLSDTSGKSTGGLTKDYAFSYSFKPMESFVVAAPHIYGGSDGAREFDEDSKIEIALNELGKDGKKQLGGLKSAYWGSLTGTSGPPYMGVVTCILFLISIFYLQNRHKWWIVALSAFVFMVSWGDNFGLLNNFLFENVPLFNKFRAPSMAFVILQCIWPLIAMLTLQQFINDPTKNKKGLLFGVIASGLLALILIVLNKTFTYENESIIDLRKNIFGADPQTRDAINNVINGLIDDRKEMFSNDIIKFLGIAIVFIGLGFAYYKKIFKLKFIIPIAASILLLIDLLPIGSTYINKKSVRAQDGSNVVIDAYTEKADAEVNLPMGKADEKILKDKSWYRVLNIASGNPFSDAPTSAYHKSVGGYHAAKLAIYQDLIENKISAEQNDLIEKVNKQDSTVQNGLDPVQYPALAMLGTKYVILSNPSLMENQQPFVLQNNKTKGNCWFVQNIKKVANDKEMMLGLTGLNPYTTAIVMAKDATTIQPSNILDSSTSISLVVNNNNTIEYKSKSSTPQFAVFSEVYYDSGWEAYIDDKASNIIRTNYALRGLQVPAGEHIIKFKFNPASYKTGRMITGIAQILILLVLAVALFFTFKEQKKKWA
jgi:hypothetical protein